jgi:ribonuclease HII
MRFNLLDDLNGTKGPVAGTDEAGRGCLAGPVTAAAVILPEDFDVPGLTDSKKLSPEVREDLEGYIKDDAVAWAVADVSPADIDRMNILQASLKAMALAVEALKVQPVLVFVDGNQSVPISIPQRTLVGGDSLVPCISAASILAKVHRDRLMAAYDEEYPGYGFAEHKGYAVALHKQAIKELGPCPLHRMSFKGVAPEAPKAHDRAKLL